MSQAFGQLSTLVAHRAPFPSSATCCPPHRPIHMLLTQRILQDVDWAMLPSFSISGHWLPTRKQFIFSKNQVECSPINKERRTHHVSSLQYKGTSSRSRLRQEYRKRPKFQTWLYFTSNVLLESRRLLHPQNICVGFTYEGAVCCCVKSFPTPPRPHCQPCGNHLQASELLKWSASKR